MAIKITIALLILMIKATPQSNCPQKSYKIKFKLKQIMINLFLIVKISKKWFTKGENIKLCFKILKLNLIMGQQI